MPLEKTAYHEAGHCVAALLLGGAVEWVTIEPDADDGPRRDGDVRIRWSGIPDPGTQMFVALAGPVAEMAHSESPVAIDLLPEWSDDWRIASQAVLTLGQTEWERARILGSILKQLAELFSRDEIWNIVAALVDELLAHESLGEEEVEAIFNFWNPTP